MKTEWFLPGLILVGVGLIYLNRQSVGAAVNPTDRDNLAYKGVNQIGDVLDDGVTNDSFNLGGSIFTTIGDYREWLD
jgi:hypothetical protein